MNFSYALPQSITRKAGLKTVRAFFNGTNLFMIYSANKLYDPEQVLINSYPNNEKLFIRSKHQFII